MVSNSRPNPFPFSSPLPHSCHNMSTFRATASRQARSLCASQRISSSSSRVASWAAARPSAGVALPRSLNNSVSLRWYSAEATKEESKKEEQQSTSSGDSKDSQSELKAVQEQHAKALEAKDGEIAKLKVRCMCRAVSDAG